MKITFIINSLSNGITDLEKEIRQHPNQDVSKAELIHTEHKGHAFKIAETKGPDKDLLIAVGGDGTLNEVINGIMSSKEGRDKVAKVGLLPRGSANDFARMQWIPPELNGLTETLENNSFRWIDVGRIKSGAGNPLHYFINVADSGIGAEVVKRLEQGSFLRRIGSSKIRFALAILRTFLAYRRKDIRIIINNDHTITGKILTVVVANSRAFASGLIVAPEAEIDDGEFHLLIASISLVDYLMNVHKLLKGQLINNPGVTYLQASHLKIEGASNLWTETDGELAVSGNIEIDCLAGAIEFLLPSFSS